MVSGVFTIIIIVISLLIRIVGTLIHLCFTRMPYVFGLIFSVLFTFGPEIMSEVAEAHPWQLFLTVLGITELVIFIMLQIVPIRKAFAILCCQIVVTIIGGCFVFSDRRVDVTSWQTCLMMTVCYSVASLMIAASNTVYFTEDSGYEHPVSAVISSIMYALTGLLFIMAPAESLWRDWYLVTGDESVWNIAYVIVRLALVVAIATIGFIHYRNQQDTFSPFEDMLFTRWQQEKDKNLEQQES